MDCVDLGDSEEEEEELVEKVVAKVVAKVEKVVEVNSFPLVAVETKSCPQGYSSLVAEIQARG